MNFGAILAQLHKKLAVNPLFKLLIISILTMLETSHSSTNPLHERFGQTTYNNYSSAFKSMNPYLHLCAHICNQEFLDKNWSHRTHAHF